MPNAAADPESDEMSGPSRTRPGWLRHVPLALIVIVALIGTFALRDYLSFETLAENRERLLAFRNDNFAGLAAIFVPGAELRAEVLAGTPSYMSPEARGQGEASEIGAAPCSQGGRGVSDY